MSGGGKGGRGASAAPIPAGSRKTVQSLKEIVNCSEAEIYATLKECNMDPSEAVHRLLTQDTFHEVKGKREKKKETKDTPESRSRSVNNNPNRGARGGADRGAHTSFSQSTSNDYGVNHAKPVYKKENETNSISASSIAGSGTAGSNLDRRSTALCETVSVQNMTQAAAIADGPPLPSQPSSGFQHNWSRMPGQLSMADIVRMGRPQGKPSGGPVARDTFHTSHDPVLPNIPHQSAMQAPAINTPSESAQEFHTSQDPLLQDDERSHEIGTSAAILTPQRLLCLLMRLT